jgi:hypothetical protein
VTAAAAARPNPSTCQHERVFDVLRGSQGLNVCVKCGLAEPAQGLEVRSITEEERRRLFEQEMPR